jgi:hypothetical protein
MPFVGCRCPEAKRFGFYRKCKIQRFRFLVCKTNISEQRQLVLGLYCLQTEAEESAQIAELWFEGMSVCVESRVTESNP